MNMEVSGMRSLSVHMLIICAALLLVSCNSEDRHEDTDGDTVEQDSLEMDSTSDGDLDAAENSAESEVEVQSDADAEQEIDTEIQSEEDNAEAEDSTGPDHASCEIACQMGQDCGLQEDSLWWLYYFCLPRCDFDELDTDLRNCLEMEECGAFAACVGGLWHPDEFADECIEYCNKVIDCETSLEGVSYLDEDPCNKDCDWIGPDERVAGCADENADCDGFNTCIDKYKPVDGDGEIPEYDCYDGPQPDYTGTPSVSNCWNDEGMIPIDGRYCIDRYEAVVKSNSDCSGSAYGQGEYDFPEGFPRCVSCVEDGYCNDEGPIDCIDSSWMGDQTVPLYACSLPGVHPTRNITWYQANKACRNAGKRLCSLEEWSFACNSGNDWPVPYGTEALEYACYTDENSSVGTGTSGGRCHCASPNGVFDMVGNVEELLSDEVDNNRDYLFTGGLWYDDYDSQWATCQPNEINNIKAWFYRQSIGFRCCRDSQ